MNAALEQAQKLLKELQHAGARVDAIWRPRMVLRMASAIAAFAKNPDDPLAAADKMYALCVAPYAAWPNSTEVDPVHILAVSLGASPDALAKVASHCAGHSTGGRGRKTLRPAANIRIPPYVTSSECVTLIRQMMMRFGTTFATEGSLSAVTAFAKVALNTSEKTDAGLRFAVADIVRAFERAGICKVEPHTRRKMILTIARALCRAYARDQNTQPTGYVRQSNIS